MFRARPTAGTNASAGMFPGEMIDEAPEPWIEAVIRRAAEDGEFDDLPLAGSAIEDLDSVYEAGWWVRKFLERERTEGRDISSRPHENPEDSPGFVDTMHPDERTLRKETK